MSEPKALKCPSCTAALTYDGVSEVITCSYCGTTVLVPDNWRSLPGRIDENDNQGATIHEILQMVEDGRKIEAIKLYRETFGGGLKEAKEAVDHLSMGQPTAVYVVGATTAATTGASGCGCLLPLMILLFIGGIFAFVFYNDRPEQAERLVTQLLAGEFEEAIEEINSTVSTLNRAVYQMPRPVTPQDMSRPQPDLFLQTWVYGGQDIPINLSYTSITEDSSRRTILWEVPLGNSGDQSHTFGVGSQAVYVAQGSALRAYALANGDPLWETVLSDQVQQWCDSCIQATREQVVVLTADNRLEAFDVQNGRSLWQWSLANTNFIRPDAGYVALALLGDWVVFIDALPEQGGGNRGLYLLDVVTGELVRRVEPACADPDRFFDDAYLGHDSQVLLDPTANTAVFLFGSSLFDTACLQKWDLTSGEPIWASRLPEGLDLSSSQDAGLYIGGEMTSFMAHTPENLLIALDNAANERHTAVVHLDLATGETIAIHTAEGYSLFPIGLSQDAAHLLVRAERERGTEQSELWALDPATSDRRWRHVITAESLFEPGPFGGEYSYRLMPDGLLLLQLLDDSSSPQLTVTKLDLATGDLLYDTATPVGRANQWRGLLWTDTAAYLAIYELFRVDMADGTAVVDWP